MNEISEPIISIDRASKSWACFDGFHLLHGFNDYSVESEALTAAKAWFRERTAKKPEIVYPRIKSLRMS